MDDSNRNRIPIDSPPYDPSCFSSSLMIQYYQRSGGVSPAAAAKTRTLGIASSLATITMDSDHLNHRGGGGFFISEGGGGVASSSSSASKASPPLPATITMDNLHLRKPPGFSHSTDKQIQRFLHTSPPPVFSSNSHSPSPVRMQEEEQVLIMDGILIKPPPPPLLNSRYSAKGPVCRAFAMCGSCVTGAMCRFVHHTVALSEIPSARQKKQQQQPQQGSNIVQQQQQQGSIVIQRQQQGCSIVQCWSPVVDGIDIGIPGSSPLTKKCFPPNREAVDAYINNVLYGSKGTRRLPVFRELCPN